MRLEAKNLSFYYETKGRQILSQFSLSADSSERVGIIAPSGFGKTTLCKILSGYEAPQSGEVLLDGKPLSEYGAYCPVQMIWQHPEQAVNPRLRMKNVIEEGDRTAPELIEKLGIEPDWIKVSTQFFGWLAGLGTGAVIVSPENIRREYVSFLKKTLKNYGEKYDGKI